MTPVEILQRAMQADLRTEDGDPIELDVRPGLSAAKIEAFEKTLVSPLPASVRELLMFTSGFYDGEDEVSFAGETNSFDYGVLSPHGLPIAADGCGNSWLVDLNSESKEWAPIYFASHDPPVFQFQAANLEQFLDGVFKKFEPPFQSETTRVSDLSMVVWKQNAGVLTFQSALAGDARLEAFAKDLGDGWAFVDLRSAKVGDGFSWGRYGPNTEVQRCGIEPIFAYRKG